MFLWDSTDLKRIRGEGLEEFSPGRYNIEFEIEYDGLGVGTLAFNNMSGLGRPGKGTLSTFKVDGKVVASLMMERTLPMILQWDESLDVRSDALADADYWVPFVGPVCCDCRTQPVDRHRRPSTGVADRIHKLKETKRNIWSANSGGNREGKPTNRSAIVFYWIFTTDESV